MRKAGLLLLLAASAAAQDVEELKGLAPVFDTTTGGGPESFRIEIRIEVGVVRVAYERGRGASLVVWNPFDGCPVLVACEDRALYYDALRGTVLLFEGVVPEFELYQEGEDLKVKWSMSQASDADDFEVKIDVGSILARCESLQVQRLGNNTWKLAGRSPRQHLRAAWIDPTGAPAYRRLAIVRHAPVSLDREAGRWEFRFDGAARPTDFPRIPGFETLSKDLRVKRSVQPSADEFITLMSWMPPSLIVAQGVVRADKRDGVEASFSRRVEWDKIGEAYAKARKALVARFGRGPLTGHYERAKDAFKAREYEEARRGFEQALEDDDTRALVHLGYIAWRVDDDVERALECFRRAANEEYAEAQFALGWLLANHREVPRDLEQSTAWHRRAAEGGHVKAAGNLALAYQRGVGVPKDRKAAARWFAVAGEAGHAEAQHALGMLLFYGKGVDQDYPKAVEWLTRAAEQGHAEAQLMLGICYFTGRGVVEDAAFKAAFRFRQAAEQGNAPAQRFLGRAYLVGGGVERDPAEAVKWLEASARQGLPEACVDLAEIYEKSQGVARNPVRAHALYTLGGKQAEAERLAKEMTPDDLKDSKRVQRLFRESR